MAHDTPLTDDLVAEILKREALQDPERFLAGVSRRSDAPRLNTQFLRNVIRDTDSHNAALRAKEESDSRARLRDMGRHEGERRRKEKRRDTGRTYESERRSKGRLSRSRSPAGGHDEREQRHRKRRKYDEDQGVRRRRERRLHSRSRSPAPRRSRYHERNSTQRRERSTSRRREDKTDRGRDESQPSKDYDSGDSDTFDVPIGPQPPPDVVPRGRGAHKPSSIDTRFNEKYDPTSDVPLELDEENEDWDMALNALRDRAKWRKTREERLRTAGFSGDALERVLGEPLSKSTAEKDISDVRWGKRGEGREWDRGKVVTGNSVEFVPEWSRLKKS